MNNDTIFALSSGHGKSGVAVIRISGDNLTELATQMTGRTPAPRHAYFANLRDASSDLIDQCLVIYFRAPQSFTGQDIIEIHSHGAPAVIEKIFTHLRESGARMATPGEFSRRAFYNNKMDLADIDGLAALLDARTDMQRKTALNSMMGGDSKIYDAWRAQMIEISAYAAAMMDYADDELPANIGEKVRTQTATLHDEINAALARYDASRAIRCGFNITLAGRPNVGKSSLFNRLVGRNRAIVSDIAGTTRDVVSEQLDIDGYLVNLSDTAGLRDGGDVIEKIGIEKTKSEIDNADLILRVYDADTAIQPTLNEIIVINKSDIVTTKNNPHAIYISATGGDGLDTLMDAIKEKIHALIDGTESSLVINARTHGLLTDAANELNQALTQTCENYDIFAEHVRRAADALGKILGAITTAEVMDATFSQLCLGK